MPSILEDSSRLEINFFLSVRPLEKVAYVRYVILKTFLPSYRIIPDSVFFVETSYFIIQKPTPLENMFVKSALQIFDAGALDFH